MVPHDDHVIGHGHPVHSVVGESIAPVARHALHGEIHRIDVAVVELGTAALRTEEALAEHCAVVRVVFRGQRLQPAVHVVGVGRAVAAVVLPLPRHLADAVVVVLPDNAACGVRNSYLL